MAPPPPPPVPLFKPAPAFKLVSNAKLQSALNAAVGAITIAGHPPRFGLTVVDLERASASVNNFASAGLNQDVEHYAASMLKVACLYAAHGLLDLAQRFALARAPKDADTLFRMLIAEVNQQIAVCCPMVAGRAPKVLLPNWRDVFTATGTGTGMTVGFTTSYKTSLQKMIVPSDDVEAGRCIRGVGYAYLNGLMLNHGFFDSGSKTGVWLAGDYGSSDVITIPCDNDTDTKQGTTTATMARLGTVIMLGSVLPAASHGHMIDLLAQSSRGSDSSFFTRPEIPHPLTHTQVTHGKIGLGPLKSKRDVYSDLNVISAPLGHGGRFIVCFTNIDWNPYSNGRVLRAFLETVRAYQSAPAAPAPAPAPDAAPRATTTHP
jgi:hypothetical protein